MTTEEKANEICKRHIFDSNHYDCCMEMAEWKERKMIEKACEWIEENIGKHIHINTDWNIPEIDYDFFINFKKAMEE